MRTTFTRWMSVDLRHDYFADGVCAALALRPTARCRRLLERYGCRFRQRRGGGDVYASESAAGMPVLDFAETAPLDFYLESSDPLLETYTDANPSGPSPAESCYHFDNLEARPADADGARLLHAVGAALAGGPLPVREGTFSYRFDAPVRDATLAVVPARGDGPVREARTPAEPSRSAIIDVDGLPPGRYALRVQDRPVMGFYLSDRPAVGFWGVVEIYPAEAGAPIPVDRSGRPVVQSHAIAMGRRKTTWRYHIVNATPGRQDYDDYTVVGRRRANRGRAPRGPGSIAFDRVAPDHAEPEGTLLFQSRETIALEERPAGEIAFTFAPKGSGANGGLRLPYGRAAGTRAQADLPDMVSDIYVYL